LFLSNDKVPLFSFTPIVYARSLDQNPGFSLC
jgi:hypothetical protein